MDIPFLLEIGLTVALYIGTFLWLRREQRSAKGEENQ